MSEYELLYGLLEFELKRGGGGHIICEQERVPLIIAEDVREQGLQLALRLGLLGGLRGTCWGLGT